MGKLFANNGHPDQTPRSAASDLGLHCLSITLLGVKPLSGQQRQTNVIFSHSSGFNICKLFPMRKFACNITPCFLELKKKYYFKMSSAENFTQHANC